MAETLNYGLYIEDDESERFINWRKKMNGSEESNMTKIDTILGQKADNSTVVTGVLYAAQWSGTQAPFTQEVSVAGLTADGNGSIGVAHSATMEQRNAARLARLSVVGQRDGKLTIAADGKDKPTMDIPVVVTLID